MTNKQNSKEPYINIVEWNTIKYEFNTPNIDEWNISENFDYESKLFTFTIWVSEIIDLSEFKQLSSDLIFDLVEESLIKKIIRSVIDTLYFKAKEKKLDYLQKIHINWTLCWVIDNWNDICLLLPNEY